VRRAAISLGVALLTIAYAPSAPAFGERIHVVEPGDTLWQIAAEVAGNPHLWPALYRANRDQIKDPSLLHPGQRLSIPDFDREPGSRGAGSRAASRSIAE
jgi:nucleoid-associated protein YgaU